MRADSLFTTASRQWPSPPWQRRSFRTPPSACISTPSRSTAATATWPSSRSNATCATPWAGPSIRGPPRSSAGSSLGAWDSRQMSHLPPADGPPLNYVLHRLLSEAAAATPRKEAVRSAGRSMTYGELDAASNGLARALIGAGVRRGDRVGIFLSKSLESVAAVYGIMKAGAA